MSINQVITRETTQLQERPPSIIEATNNPIAETKPSLPTHRCPNDRVPHARPPFLFVEVAMATPFLSCRRVRLLLALLLLVASRLRPPVLIFKRFLETLNLLKSGLTFYWKFGIQSRSTAQTSCYFVALVLLLLVLVRGLPVLAFSFSILIFIVLLVSFYLLTHSGREH